MQRIAIDDLQSAAELLKAGKLVAFPTETVYGLGACVFQPDAVQAIFTAKGRPSDNPLIAHISDLDQVFLLARSIPPLFFRLAERFFPGPLTLVLRRSDAVPSIVSAGLDTIALRMPSHPIAQKLISLAGQPLVAPSANLSGRPSATIAEHVIEDLDGRIAAVVDGGPTRLGIESTVVSLLDETPRLMRPGSISQEEIEAYLGLSLAEASDIVCSPGMKHRHYCPKTPIRLYSAKSEIEAYLANAAPAKRVLLSRPALSFSGAEARLLSAESFYSLLRAADNERFEEILILCDEGVQSDAGLSNRVLRAAGCI